MAEEKVIDYKEFEKEQKRRERQQKIDEAKEWAKANPAVTLAIISTGLGLMTVLVKGIIRITNSVIRSGAVRAEANRHKHEIYDYSLRRYWQLKRPLSNKEMREIEARKDTEKLGAILADLNVLK